MKFCAHYHYRGETWSLIIDADDWEDARERCKKLGLTPDGELIGTFPAYFGWFARSFVFIRNMFIGPFTK